MQSKYNVLCLLICFFFSLGLSQQYGAVLLGDVKALTLQNGYYTTGRRIAPVPQLRCVGGTAECQAFVPKVVQCINMGPNGMDYLWECKTEMDKKYKLGKILVTCEGFNDPQDPYVLKGSCGLEYTLDLTEWGLKGSHQHSSYGRTYKSDSHKQRKPVDAPDACAGFVGLVIIIAIVVLVYKYNTQEVPPVVYPQPLQPPIFGFTDPTQPRPYGNTKDCPGSPSESGSSSPSSTRTASGFGDIKRR